MPNPQPISLAKPRAKSERELFEVPLNTAPRERLEKLRDRSQKLAAIGKDVAELAGTSLGEIGRRGAERWMALAQATASDLQPSIGGPLGLARDYQDYLVDAWQRWVLTLDALRRRGNAFIEHQRQGCPPVLVFDYEMVLDGRELRRPVNYALVRILPPDGREADRHKRPFILVDPRAGHGAGIGGFKSDSQVGVALRAGHPVYFVVFFPDPEAGQTIVDVCRAEAQFVRAVAKRHADAPKPVVIGNCQGGWAVMMLGASEPAVTGPLVINGAPLSYWAGKRGTNPMRYLGGLVGGVWPALLLSGLGNGKFDGANLVANFESLNPANTLWTKYYNLYSKIDTEASRFLEFERWWGGFYLMNEDEIRWIVDNLFIGNKLAKGRVELDGRTLVDLREIRSPIIVFASSGDNITPPQQALNWIADMYQDVREIKARGQTIVYMVHEDIGHLGIFVSAKIATKEHREIVGTLESIESLPPGLYEMVITERAGAGPEATYRVEFAERSIRDILELDDARADEELFEAVQAVSRVHEGIYDLYVRPQLQAVTTEASGELFRQLHPLRVRRRLYSDFNPLFWGWGMLAESVQAARRPAQPDSPFLRAERAAAAGIESALDLYRDLRDLAYEAAFFSIFGGLRALGLPPMHPVAPEQLPEALLRQEPEVQRALDGVDQGGFAEAVVRMLVLLAQSRGSVRRSRLERSAAYLRSNAPFAGMTPDERARIIRTQTIIVDFEPEKALATLPRLLIDTNDRQRAVDVVKTIAGPAEEMVETTRLMLTELEQVLGLAEPSGPDPVRAVDALPRAHGTASDTTDAAA